MTIAIVFLDGGKWDVIALFLIASLPTSQVSRGAGEVTYVSRHNLTVSEQTVLHQLEMKLPTATVVLFRRFAFALAYAKHYHHQANTLRRLHREQQQAASKSNSRRSLVTAPAALASPEDLPPAPRLSWRDTVMVVTCFLEVGERPYRE